MRTVLAAVRALIAAPVAWAAGMVAVPFLAAWVALAVGVAPPVWLARLPVLPGDAVRNAGAKRQRAAEPGRSALKP
jgi:hypothetical protein